MEVEGGGARLSAKLAYLNPTEAERAIRLQMIFSSQPPPPSSKALRRAAEVERKHNGSNMQQFVSLSRFCLRQNTICPINRIFLEFFHSNGSEEEEEENTKSNKEEHFYSISHFCRIVVTIYCAGLIQQYLKSFGVVAVAEMEIQCIYKWRICLCLLNELNAFGLAQIKNS